MLLPAAGKAGLQVGLEIANGVSLAAAFLEQAGACLMLLLCAWLWHTASSSEYIWKQASQICALRAPSWRRQRVDAMSSQSSPSCCSAGVPLSNASNVAATADAVAQAAVSAITQAIEATPNGD